MRRSNLALRMDASALLQHPSHDQQCSPWHIEELFWYNEIWTKQHYVGNPPTFGGRANSAVWR
jgi:hypothetical protein